MKKIVLSALMAVGVWLGAAPVQAAEGGIAWDKATIDSTNTASLQNGAKIFVNDNDGEVELGSRHGAKKAKIRKTMD